jgi:hypothetical protein
MARRAVDPIVKGWSTEQEQEGALGVQMMGGMESFTKRPARRNTCATRASPRSRGSTTGIQANDLIGRNWAATAALQCAR